MNYYISGSSGFIGQAMAEHILKKTKTVYAINKKMDIFNLTRLFELHKPDYIIHLASYGNHNHQDRFPVMVEANIMNTYNILEAVKHFDYKKFYNVSTSSIMLKDQTLYSITKHCGEQLAAMYKNVVTVRPYSVYGPGEASHRFIPTVIDCLNSGNEMILDKEAVHAWIYIDDMIKAMFAGETELGGRMISNKEIVDILQDISGKKLKFTTATLRDYDCGDIEGPGICYTSLYDGLKQTYEYFTQ